MNITTLSTLLHPWLLSDTSRPRRIAVQFGMFSLMTAALINSRSTTAASGSSPDELRIVFIAYENPDQLTDNVRPVLAYLEKALQIKVKHFVATDYSGVVEALRNQTADMGFMGPLQYIIAHDQAGAYPILGEVYGGKTTYVSRIFVRKDSGYRKIEDLKGKTIAFVDPISSSGYLYPVEIFKDKGLVKDRPEDFFKRVYFAGGDEQAIRAVLNGFVNAAGIGQFAFGLLRAAERDEVTFIAESKPIPSHCLVVRKGMDETTVRKLEDALLALNEEGPHHGLLKHLYNIDGYVKVTHETYKDVERQARTGGFIK